MKKQPSTPRSRVRATLRQLWLRSRERAAAVKRESNCCESCGAKGSKAKGKEVAIEVHHLNGVPNWDHIIDTVYRHLLCNPKDLMVLCKTCHDQLHREGEI